MRGSVYVQLPEQARPWGEEAGEWSGAGEGLEVTAQGGRVPFRTDERVLGVERCWLHNLVNASGTTELYTVKRLTVLCEFHTNNTGQGVRFPLRA